MTEKNIRPGYYRAHVTAKLLDGSECVVEVECADLIDALGLPWRLSNVLKYLWRAGKKHAERAEDLRKARTYLDLELRTEEPRGFVASCSPVSPYASAVEQLTRVPTPAPAAALAAFAPTTLPDRPVVDVPQPTAPGEWTCASCGRVKTSKERYPIPNATGVQCAQCNAFGPPKPHDTEGPPT